MVKFFDCLNVNNLHSGKHKRKVFQESFRPNDFMLKVLVIVYSEVNLRVRAVVRKRHFVARGVVYYHVTNVLVVVLFPV